MYELTLISLTCIYPVLHPYYFTLGPLGLR